jgi:CBS domain-containing protein
MLLLIGEFLNQKVPSLSIPLGMSVSDALVLMRKNNFSQLPVLDAASKLAGVVTEASILRAAEATGCAIHSLAVADAMTQIRPARIDDDLFSVFDQIEEDGFIIVVKEGHEYVGIITTYDTTEFFRQRTEDLLVIEDIEESLKDYIKVLYSVESQESSLTLEDALDRCANPGRRLKEQFRKALISYTSQAGISGEIREEMFVRAFTRFEFGDSAKPFEMLTFDELKEIFVSHPGCPVLACDPSALKRLLEAVRDMRNKLAHFRGKLNDDEREKLKYCSTWLDQAEAHVYSLRPPPVETATVEAAPDEPSEVPEVASASTDQPVLSPENRYELLGEFLTNLSQRTKSKTLTFREVERIIGSNLPSAATSHRVWWANNPDSPQAKQWLDAGWRTARVNLTDERLDFSRNNEREQDYIAFFSALLSSLRHERSTVSWKAVSPQGSSWHPLAVLPCEHPAGFYLNAAFSREGVVRVELFIDTTDKDENKRLFDELKSLSNRIAPELAHSLVWERLDNRRGSKVALPLQGAMDAEGREALVTTLVTGVLLVLDAFDPLIAEICRAEQ